MLHKNISKEKNTPTYIVYAIQKALQSKKSLIYGDLDVRFYILDMAGLVADDLLSLSLSTQNDTTVKKNAKLVQDYVKQIDLAFEKKMGRKIGEERLTRLDSRLEIYATTSDVRVLDGIFTSLDSIKQKQFDFIYHKDYFLYQKLISRTHSLGLNIKKTDSLLLSKINSDKLFKTISLLDTDGVMCLVSSDTFFSKKFGFESKSSEGKKTQLTLIQLLESYGVHINAILGFNRTKTIQNIYIFSKNKTKSLFVQEVTSNNYSPDSLIDFLQGRYDFMLSITEEGGMDLNSGFVTNKNDFKSFSDLKAKNDVRLYQQYYKNYKVFQLKDLIVNLRSHNEDKEEINTNEIMMLATYPQKSRDIVEIPDDEVILNYGDYSFSIRNNIIKEYLVIYFQSKFGESQYKSHLSQKNTRFFLAKESLEKIPIFVPSIEMQKQIILADEKVKKLQHSIDTHRETLALNPSEFITESMDKVNDMLEIVGKLNIADKIRGLVRKGESDILEYKETLSWDVDQNKVKHKVLETTTLKNIVGFINNRGGMLLIGVTDSQKITGIDFEIKKLHGNSVDDFLLHFKNLIKDRIGTNFYEYIPEYDVHSVDGKLVLLIRCLPTPKSPGCYLDGKDFYVRRNPGTDKLDGPKLVEYTNSHFRHS